MKRRDGERDRLKALVEGEALTLADVLAPLPSAGSTVAG